MKQLNDLWLFGVAALMLIIVLLFNRCEKEEYKECYTEFQRELVRIEGVEIEVYYQITLCEGDDGFDVWQ